ncbi:endonuclease/exonuclease/phosphatase family protein [Nocardia yunnanensis]|uniref:Endonuclease/exonuclease/phosphatase family protein n=1 Tax=Nocardia yunnanensis TaxID=2382165 RepID=A0A386ZBZ0_9NOCA|nr:endonuclease/exonuclease/phosphatase family protein [Nocardia yunnanensis]AYF74604.1 endonuclease/exonuclease/phosphatase family protein [Nocardia yunnanensis]
MITVATWNVLHRVHADNWDSDIAGRWPIEAERIEAVTAVVAARAESVIALMEVSGDQLVALRNALPAREFHVLNYPRVPRPRRLANVLEHRTEHLVILVDGTARPVAAESFGFDPGKGVLVIEFDGLLIAATHVTGDERRGEQLVRLRELTAAGPAVLLGDFNIDRATLAAGLGDGYTVGEFAPDALPTRPRDAGAKSQYIDHVVGHGVPVREVVVEDVAGASDHNLVRAIVG